MPRFFLVHTHTGHCGARLCYGAHVADEAELSSFEERVRAAELAGDLCEHCGMTNPEQWGRLVVMREIEAPSFEEAERLLRGLYPENWEECPAI